MQGDLSAGLERYKLCSLSFNSPVPPATFEYIVASERVGEAKEHTDQDSLLLGPAHDIEELQHSLDGLGRGYDDSGRLRCPLWSKKNTNRLTHLTFLSTLQVC